MSIKSVLCTGSSHPMRYLRIRHFSSLNKDASVSTLASARLTGDAETVKTSTPLTERVHPVSKSEEQKNTETELQKEMLLLKEERIKHEYCEEQLNKLRNLRKKEKANDMENQELPNFSTVRKDLDRKETLFEYVHRLSGEYLAIKEDRLKRGILPSKVIDEDELIDPIGMHPLEYLEKIRLITPPPSALPSIEDPYLDIDQVMADIMRVRAKRQKEGQTDQTAVNLSEKV
ncbi:MAG: hypothetical protein ABSA17_06220 [Rhabdochlamydiaceae bacterium]|jgi:hypothetical protein